MPVAEGLPAFAAITGMIAEVFLIAACISAWRNRAERKHIFRKGIQDEYESIYHKDNDCVGL